jgi:hypothetical protein
MAMTADGGRGQGLHLCTSRTLHFLTAFAGCSIARLDPRSPFLSVAALGLAERIIDSRSLESL